MILKHKRRQVRIALLRSLVLLALVHGLWVRAIVMYGVR